MNTNHLVGFVEELEISKINPPKAPIRERLEHTAELMISIHDNGLLNPIIVRAAGTKFEVVAGHRRYYACKKLRWTRIPAQVVEADDKEALELAITENVQHETLSPIEAAIAFRKYVDEYGYGGISELARKIGRSEQYVSQYLQLLKLPRSIREKLSTRVVTLAQARELVGLDEEQQRTVTDMIVTEKLSSRQVRKVATVLSQTGEASDLPFGSPKTYSESARRMRETDRTLGKCLASLRVCLMKFDELVKQIDENEFILRESLIGHRMSISHQMDSLIRLRKRIKQTLI